MHIVHNGAASREGAVPLAEATTSDQGNLGGTAPSRDAALLVA
jgi:hypothetical protein